MERFKKVYQQGIVDVIEIWIDTETGVNYVFHRNGNAAGFENCQYPIEHFFEKIRAGN